MSLAKQQLKCGMCLAAGQQKLQSSCTHQTFYNAHRSHRRLIPALFKAQAADGADLIITEGSQQLLVYGISHLEKQVPLQQ